MAAACLSGSSAEFRLFGLRIDERHKTSCRDGRALLAAAWVRAMQCADTAVMVDGLKACGRGFFWPEANVSGSKVFEAASTIDIAA